MTLRIREWRLGDAALIQCNGFHVEPGIPWQDNEDETWNEDMTGAEATARIKAALEGGCEPLVDEEDGTVYGYFQSSDYIICYFDCDECSYEEHYGNN